MIDEPVINRYTREGGYPWTLLPQKKTGFPIKDFGNDELKRTFYEAARIRRLIGPILKTICCRPGKRR